MQLAFDEVRIRNTVKIDYIGDYTPTPGGLASRVDAKN
jgi:hypothetical protein